MKEIVHRGSTQWKLFKLWSIYSLSDQATSSLSNSLISVSLHHIGNRFVPSSLVVGFSHWSSIEKSKKRAGKLMRVPICARKFHGVVVLFFCLFLCSFLPSFPLVSFSFAPRRSLREISKSCFRFKSYSTGSNPYYSRAHLMATSLQRPLIFVPADIPYIHCYFHPSSTATSPQRKRPLKLFPAAKNCKLFNDWRTVNTQRNVIRIARRWSLFLFYWYILIRTC